MKVKIKELGDIITGNTPSKKNLEFWDSKDICFIKPDIIADEGITAIDKSNEHIAEAARTKARVVGKDTIFVTCIGSIGKIGIAEEGEYAFNQQINVVVPNSTINARYLAYAILYSKPQLIAIANSAVVPIINKSQFGDFEINIVEDIKRQEEIVNILDRTKGIVESRQQELMKLDELIKARFIELFGDIKLNEKQFPIKKLNEISQYWNGLTYKPENVVKNEKDGILVLRSSNIQNGSLCFDDNVYVNCMIKEKQYVKENDILMCSRNGSARLVGKTALIKGLNKPTSFGAFMMIIRSDYYPYLKIFFEMDSFKKQISTGTSTINQITVKMLNQVELPVPSMNFVYEFNQFCKQVDKSRYVSGFYKYIKHNKA